ncbi:hypothetical protein FI667_g16698, partial [Globisporangium splendens]
MTRTNGDANSGDAPATRRAIHDQDASEATVRPPDAEYHPEKVVLQRTTPSSLGIGGASSDSGGFSFSSSSQDRKRRAGALCTTESDENSGRSSAAGRTDGTADHISSPPQSKEEKALLLKEIKYLEAQIDFLCDLPENSTDARIAARVQRENELLDRAARKNQVELAQVQSVLARTLVSQRSPMDHYIRLGADWGERQATLASLRERVLCDAKQYNHARARYLPPSESYSTVERFTSPEGDLCIANFEVCPLHGVTSVKEVYDALRFFYFHLDISFTQTSGNSVVREEKPRERDVVADRTAQQRIARTNPFGPVIESNQVVFSDYHAVDDEYGCGQEFAVIALDYVNDDELYPYHPAERLRQDMTAAITLKTFRREQPASSSSSSVSPEDVYDVVLYRTYFTKVHKTTLSVPSDTFENAEHAVELCSKAVLRTVFDIVRELDPSGTSMTVNKEVCFPTIIIADNYV